MENYRKNKNLLRSILSFVLAAVMVLAYFAFPLGLTAKAIEIDEDEYTGIFETTQLTISNGQFANSTGSFPKSPTSWTGAPLDTDSGNIISGVIDLTSDSYISHSDTYRLSEYPEYANGVIPRTPFGRAPIDNGSYPYYEDTNTSVLMLNTNGIFTTYKYSSQSITLSANSYYRISAWVKTSDYNDYQNSGAAIKISGIEGEDIGFNNINTVKDLARDNDIPVLNLDNNFGWQRFSIYLATDYKAQSINVNLQIGDSGEDYYYPTRGYAFFDNVTAHQIAPEIFQAETRSISDNILVADLNESEYLTKNDNETGKPELDQNNLTTEIGSFSNVSYGNLPVGWTSINEENVGGANYGVYNPKLFTTSNSYGIKSNPSAPQGIDSPTGNNILVISSPNKRLASGLKSSNILIERNRYYRIAAWVRTENTSTGAAIAIKGENTAFDSELDVSSTALKGDIENVARYGWKQYAFLIKGSSVIDCLVRVELWLGYTTAPSNGVAMFDDVTIETITEQEYTNNLSEGTEVVLDSPLNDRTGISNGMFYVAGSYEDYEYPLPPSQWTMYDAVSAETRGYSTNSVETEDVVSGIMPVDKNHFNNNRQNYLGAVNPLPNEIYPRNVLFMASPTKTAFCYRSTDISIATSSINRIHVELMTDMIDGYGANLVLKNGDKILSTIENIDTKGEFRTFSFYVEGHPFNANTITLEIWLGLGDKQSNRTKLSSGHVFVKEAGFEALATEEAFSTYIDNYSRLAHTNVASLNNNYFINFDRYSKSFLKESYDWSLDTSRNPNTQASNTQIGIFDYSEINTSGQSIVPTDFTLDESGNKNIFMLHNTAPNAATAIFPTTYTLEESKYYEITVSMKVDIPEQFLADNPDAVGAGIALRGTTYAFTDIKDSRTLSNVYDKTTDDIVERYVDNDFKTYTFFVRTSASAAASVSFEISLGGYENTKQFCMGKVYVADFTIEEVTEDLYNESVADLEDDDPHIINANLTVAADEEEEEVEINDGTGESWWQKNWYVVPSAIFGLTLVFVLVVAVVRKIAEFRPKRAKKAKKKAYDRKAVAEASAAESNEAKVTKTYSEMSFDEFDDDIPDETLKQKFKDKPATPKAKPVESEEVGTSDEATTDETVSTKETSSESEFE